jgi:hypothetical protein
MTHVAMFAMLQEVASAAEYFSKQRLLPRVEVLERARVPRARVLGLIYAAIDGGGDELLGDRLLEFSADPGGHEKRDEAMRYRAYVPVCALRHGRDLALGSGAKDRNPGIYWSRVTRPSCAGWDSSRLSPDTRPRIYCQILAFKSGARAGPAGVPMQAVVVAGVGTLT